MENPYQSPATDQTRRENVIPARYRYAWCLGIGFSFAFLLAMALVVLFPETIIFLQSFPQETLLIGLGYGLAFSVLSAIAGRILMGWHENDAHVG